MNQPWSQAPYYTNLAPNPTNSRIGDRFKRGQKAKVEISDPSKTELIQKKIKRY